ncbi:MAG: hypothetical protein HC911_15855 [Chloroflexaceae bacterium]|nr:hypothetical protein [Chloroflexaceae bacterium]
MAVTRRPLTARPVTPYHEDRAWAAPMDRAYLDRTRVPARGALGLILIGYSTIATVVYINTLLAPSIGNSSIFGLDAGVLIGLLIAAILTAGQWFSNGYNWFAYAVFLAPDVWITYEFTYPLLAPIVPDWAFWFAIAWAVFCARFGEALLLGKVR